MRLVYARDNDLTYNSIRIDIRLQNFKKPLDIFWPQLNKKKRSEDAVKTKVRSERFSCLEFKIANTGKPA